MLRRISVPFLILALGALSQGCSSSSSGGGTGGAGGVAVDGGTGGKGTGGVATGTGGRGTGGTTTAAGGATGTDAATDTPRDVAQDVATDVAQDATTDSGVNIPALCPRVDGGPGRGATSPAMTATEFCQLYLQTCMGATNPDAGYTMLAECMTAYTGLNAQATRECRSYHVCNAAAYADITMPNVVRTHCGHSIGIGLCADTTSDAGGN